MTIILTNSLVQFVVEYQAAIITVSITSLVICLLQQQRRRVAAANAVYLDELENQLAKAREDDEDYYMLSDCTRFHYVGGGEKWVTPNGKVILDTRFSHPSKDVAYRGISSN